MFIFGRTADFFSKTTVMKSLMLLLGRTYSRMTVRSHLLSSDISVTNEQFSTLSSILTDSRLQSLFQPIICLSERRILGYEALTRGPSNSPLHSPVALLCEARRVDRLTELEDACRKSACRRFKELQLPGKLFLNVSPDSLLEAAQQPAYTLQLLQGFGISPSQVVIELTEQAPTDDFELLQAALHQYRAMGFSIALDDLGAGYSSLRLWSELRPDYVKIDRHFIEGIHLDELKREFVGSILQIAKASRAQVIAEGIELQEELDVLAEMGVDLVQGYLLGRPQEYPLHDVEASLPNDGSNSLMLNDKGCDLTPLLSDHPVVHRDTPTAKVMDTFSQQVNLNSLAVLDEKGRPCGIVTRHMLADSLLESLATKALAHIPISLLMSHDYVAVEITQSLQEVRSLINGLSRQRIENDLIITLNGRYLCLGRATDLVKQITELKIQLAHCANPLIQLPGSVAIHQCLTRLLQECRESIICYVGIDNFDLFNDMYGRGRSDEVLRCLEECLGELIYSSSDFVGHIGSNAFLLVLGQEDWCKRLNELQDHFQSQCRRFHRPEHLEASCLTNIDCQEGGQAVPLLSLSIGVVHFQPENYADLDSKKLIEMAWQAKCQASGAQYNEHVIDHACSLIFTNSSMDCPRTGPGVTHPFARVV